MNFESVRSIIDTYIKKNGVEAITGDILNNVLNTMLDDVDTAISSIEPSPGGGSGEGGVSEEDVLNILEKNAYATQSWVNEQGFAKISDYYTKAQSDARYLALSGGTISGDTDALKIMRNTNGYSAITYYNTQNGVTTLLGVMGFDSNSEPSAYRASDNAWRTILHSGNYSSYALPISGGNLTGRLVAQAGLSSWQGADLFSSERLALNLNTNNAYGVYATLQQSDVTKFMWGYSPILGAAWFENANSLGFYLSDNGNFGIGTTSPAYKLDVVGSIATSESLHIKSNDATADIYPIQGLYEKEAIAIQTAFDKQDPQTSSYPSSYPTRVVLALQPRGGYVGIGTTTPQYKLDVYGDSRINGNLVVSGDVASA